MGKDEQWVLSSIYLKQVADLLAEMGVAVEQWLAQQGLRRDILDQDVAVSWAVVRHLFLDAETISREPALGLMVGERLRINNHGIVGYAAMNSGTVRQVVDLLERFVPLRINLVQVCCRETERHIEVQVEPVFPLGDVAPFLIGAVVMALKNILDFVTLGNCQTSSVSFAFTEHFDKTFADSLFRCPVRFEQSWNGFSIPLSVVDRPLVTADAVAFEHAQMLCERELHNMQADSSISAKVRRLMLINQGHFPTLNVAARILNMTPRTLHRRLLDEQTSFQMILDDVRHKLAVEYMKGSDVSIQELAYALGYNDASNFRRAFRRWTGVTPSFYRDRLATR
ncbi:AraC family transcriptional regulator [Alcanivorax hongdengensis A-11-3]|uniref:AraC family transcriptional regulator n=1 Tax=Alcanivorax hongdengensis A-11-3 TaxID=1177179 RepID=L0WFM4_9GAMM|nr:AraC family transcriptional regulator [Alcanivorax hongdengensis]EKF74620.1 AraC family transcriptional regulator [Alcanivorax hongdengensis A-11-3]